MRVVSPKTRNARDVYMIHLTGQGDVDIALVDRETFEWVTSKQQGRPAGDTSSGWIDQSVPASVKARLPRDAQRVQLTIGSWENDRALTATLLRGVKRFTEMREALAHIREHKLKVVDTYEGYIY